MKCDEIDLKGYFLEELPDQERRAAEGHLRSCAQCRMELDRLRSVRRALESLPEKEMPRRIAFVSDRVLEPSWWTRFWQSGPRLGFASAAMLSIAILAHALVPATRRPVETPKEVLSAAQVQEVEARLRRQWEIELQKRVAEAVQSRLAARESEFEARLQQVVRETEARMAERQRRELRNVEDAYEMIRKQLNLMYYANASLRGM